MFRDYNITFTNRFDGIKLFGKLSLPSLDNKCPCVILISGSGPQNRDQNIQGHKIFKDIAHYFTNNGIAVLRFDDRGVEKSEGVFENAFLEDFKKDVISAFYFLEDYPLIDNRYIGVLGHSIGGLVASMTAVELKNRISFLVSLAGPAMIGYKLYINQHELISKIRGAKSNEITKITDSNKKLCDLILKTNNNIELMKKIKYLLLENYKDKSILLRWFLSIRLYILFYLNKKAYEVYTQPWFKEWLFLNPKDFWNKVECPVLAVSGEKDLQVPPQNLDLIKKYIQQGGNNNIVTHSFNNMNHLFQNADKGLPEEYVKINSSISIEVLEYVRNWINSIVQDGTTPINV